MFQIFGRMDGTSTKPKAKITTKVEITGCPMIKPIIPPINKAMAEIVQPIFIEFMIILFSFFESVAAKVAFERFVSILYTILFCYNIIFILPLFVYFGKV